MEAGRKKFDGKMYEYGGSFSTKPEARAAVIKYKKILKTRQKRASSALEKCEDMRGLGEGSKLEERNGSYGFGK